VNMPFRLYWLFWEALSSSSERATRYSCPGGAAAIPPLVGPIASAVLVRRLWFCFGRNRTAREASLRRFGRQLDHRCVGAARLSNHIGGDEIIVSRNSSRDSSCRSSHGGTYTPATTDHPHRPCRRCVWRGARYRVPRSSDHLRCRSRPIRAIADPDLMHPNMGSLGHVMRLAR
jgi:hypothetical protein